MDADITLSPAERAHWEEQGFVGPFRAWSPTEAERLRRGILATDRRISRVYGFPASRDRHLDSRVVFEAGTHAAIVERVAALLGDDVLLWRSNLFHKPPGAEEILWHQGRDFPGMKTLEPAIDPAVSVTAWVALSPAVRENGCMRVLPGSHRRWYEPVPSEDGGIFGRGLRLEGLPDVEPAYLELEPGQFFLFNQSTVHGSDANTADFDRTGVAFRFTPTSTRIYAGREIDGSGMPLARWHAVLVHGSDTHGHNRLGPPPAGDDPPDGLLRQVTGRLRRRYYQLVHGLP